MNRIRLFSFRKASDGTGGVWWGLYDVYYYYAGGYVGFDRQDITSVTLTSQQQSDYPEQSIIIGAYSPVELCVGGFVRKFKGQTFSPYAQIIDTTDVCGVVCDVAISSWAVTNASGVGVPDGQIAVTASSGHGPLEYRLDNGPVEDYQSDSVFTDLLPNKIYYLRVRDAAGCIATQSVFVGVTIATYGELHRLEYYDIADQLTRISIFQKGYTGAYDERDAAETFLSISWNAQGDDKYKAIKPSECTVQLFSETSFEHLGLFTSDDRQYRIDIYKDEALYWRGYLLPDFYEEPYVAARYIVTIRATDGLGDLKGQYFLSSAKEMIEAKWTELQLIRFCVDKLDLDLPMYCGVNVFETTMDDGPDDDPLNQAYLNTKLFYGADGQPYDMFEVINNILLPYGARLHLTKGAFQIENVNELADVYRRRKYDALGAFVASEDYDPIAAIGNPNLGFPLFWVTAAQQLAVLPGQRLVTLLQDYGLKANLLPDGEFKASAFSSPTHLKKWTTGPSGASMEYRQTGSDAPTSAFTGALYGGIPPKATATKGNAASVIKRAQKISDSYGVDIAGSYMQADSFGRVALFYYTVVILPGLFSYHNAFYNVNTGQIEYTTEQIAGVDYAAATDLVDTYSGYEICEDGHVTKFKFSGTAPVSSPVVKEATIATCPLNFGVIGYLESQSVQLYQESRHTLAFSLEYDVIAPIDPRGGSFGQSTAIAALFLVQLRIKIGAYYLGNAGWTTDESFVYIAPSDVNQFVTQTFETAPIPADGLFTVRIYKLVFNGEKKYRYENQARLRIKNFVVTLLVDGLDVKDSLLMTTKISDKFNVVPDQIGAIAGDLPLDNINDDAVYLGGKYVFRPDPIGIAYNGYYPSTIGLSTTVVAGTGSQPGLDYYQNGDEVWLVEEGDTLADKQGPYHIIAYVTANSDIIIDRPMAAVIIPQNGRLYSTKELNEDYYLTQLWKRRGPTAADPETPRELLRILLQNVANNFSRPSQVLRGTLRGPLSFANTLIDAENEGKAFFPTGLVLDDYQQQWSGEWVELIPGYTGDYPTEPDPAEQLRGQSTFEDGGKKLWEDGAYAKWEDA